MNIKNIFFMKMAECVGGGCDNNKQYFKKTNPKVNNKEFTVKKRVPHRPVSRENDIFITNKTNFKAQLEKCSNLLLNGESEIFLHGLGAAITRCVNLALQLEAAFHGTCTVEVNTSTVNLVDDLEPITDENEFGSQVRQNSSIHIRIARTALLAAN